MIDNDLLYKKISNASAFVVIKNVHSPHGRRRIIDVAKLRGFARARKARAKGKRNAHTPRARVLEVSHYI